MAAATSGRAKQGWFHTFLRLPNGIPSHDTFGRVFARLDPQQFQQTFVAWIQALSELTQGQVVAIDGKKLRRLHDQRLGKQASVMVSTWGLPGLHPGWALVAELAYNVLAAIRCNCPTGEVFN